jgi:hypothetical protein
MINKDQMKEWADKSGRTMEDMEKEYQELMVSDVIRGITDAKMRELEALRVLKSRYARRIISAGLETNYKVLVLRKGAARTVKTEQGGIVEDRPVQNMYVIGQKEGGGDYQYVRMAAWGDDVAILRDVQPGGVYKVNCREKNTKGRLELTATKNSTFILDGSAKPDKLAATVKKILETAKYTDYGRCSGNQKSYLIEGSVIRHFISEKDGRKFASYGVKPSDADDVQWLIDTGGLTVWIEPDMLKYGEDSLLLFVGPFNTGKNGQPAMQCEVIVPVSPWPLNLPVPESATQAPAAPNPGAPMMPQSTTTTKSIFDNVEIVDGDDPFK